MTHHPGESVARQLQGDPPGDWRAQAARGEGAGPFDGPPLPGRVRLGGGCLCGAVRFELTDWPEVVNCHCRICRRMSGAAFSTWASVPSEVFRLLQGSIRTLRLSDRAERGLCPLCGSLLTMAIDGVAEVSVTLGSLDEGGLLRPEASIWRAEALGWAGAVDAGLPGRSGDAPAFVAGGRPRAAGLRGRAAGTFMRGGG